MAARQDDEMREIEEASAALEAERTGVDPGRMAQQLAGTMASTLGESVADRYANIGAKMLSDPMPSRLDTDLIDRLANVGFDRDRLRGIRVHRGLRAHAAADALGARAFAVGDNDVFFARGEFDPATREGRAVIAHEVAHIAPPARGVTAGMPSSFGGAPMLNERKRGDDEGGEDEAEERQARDAEAMVYAADDPDGVGPTMAEAGTPDSGPAAESQQPTISERHLEDMVLGIIRKLERSEIERRGRF
jgi:hypothetical protein